MVRWGFLGNANKIQKEKKIENKASLFASSKKTRKLKLVVIDIALLLVSLRNFVLLFFLDPSYRTFFPSVTGVCHLFIRIIRIIDFLWTTYTYWIKNVYLIKYHENSTNATDIMIAKLCVIKKKQKIYFRCFRTRYNFRRSLATLPFLNKDLRSSIYTLHVSLLYEINI